MDVDSKHYAVTFFTISTILLKGGITSDFDFPIFDAGQNISHVIVSEEGGVFVGGTNFVAHLSTQLDLIFNVSIGPVKNSEHCAPRPAPCDNEVKVMKIDPTLRMLLVCGTAYQGTCTYHVPYFIYEWYCVTEAKESKQPSSDVIAGEKYQNTVVHFLDPVIVPFSTISGEPLGPTRNCRPFSFAAYPVGRSKSVPKSDTGKDFNEVKEEAESEPSLISSRLMSAGSVTRHPYDASASGDPLLLSLRRITNYGFYQFRMSYEADGKDVPKGLEIDPEIKQRFYLDYKFSFAWKNFSYFLALQQSNSSECGGAGTCIVTKISRVCHDSPTLLPFVEFPITCEYDRAKHKIATSAVFASVGLSSASNFSEIPVLIVAFGSQGSDPRSPKVEPQKGGAVCVFTIDRLNTEFDSTLSWCNPFMGLAEPASWIKGSAKECTTNSDTMGLPEQPKKVGCDHSYSNPHVQGTVSTAEQAVVTMPNSTAMSILTYTPKVQDISRSQLSEELNVYLILLDGRINKFSLKARQSGGTVSVFLDSGLSKYHDLKKAFSLEGPPIVGATNSARGYMYISLGYQVLGLSLEYCRQFEVCSSCRVEKQCRWCPKEGVCRDTDTARTLCPGSPEDKCPPRIDIVDPSKIPTEGGSVLTIQGAHLGSTSEGPVAVNICGQPCKDIVANQNSITCTVPPLCKACPSSCNINVTVEAQHDSYGALQFNQQHLIEYVDPKLTSVSPLYGPMSGGTLLTVTGENLDAGSQRWVKVEDSFCFFEKLLNDGKICRVSQSVHFIPTCGQIEINIDNFKQTLKGRQFCFRSNPIVTALTPLDSIESGGLTIRVFGSSFTSVAVTHLVFQVSYKVAGSTTTYSESFESICTVASKGNVMKCLTPDIRNMTRDHGIIFHGGFLTASLKLDMDGTDMLASLEGASTMHIHRDPRLLQLVEGTSEAIIYTNNSRFMIRGDYIPSWIDLSEIVIHIGNTVCPVTEVTAVQIYCDASEAISLYVSWFEQSEGDKTGGRGDTNNTTNTTTSRNNTFTEQTSPSWVEISTEMFFESTTQKNDIITKTTRSVRSRHPRRWQRSVSKHNDSAGSQIVGDILYSDERNKNKSISEDHDIDSEEAEVTSPVVRIQIGNFKDTLGPVAIKLGTEIYKNASSGLSPKMTAVMAGVGLLALVVFIVMVVCIVRARKAKTKAKEMQYYMGSLSSAYGSRETALPSLKYILESMMEPDMKEEMDKLIVTEDRLTVGKSIGSGNFGCVYEGWMASDSGPKAARVALKTLQDSQMHNIDLRGFIQEALLMKDFKHPHVLGLVGLADRKTGIPYVILPYMENGDLLTYVRDPKVDLSLHDVIKFSADIASGMAYLSALKFVHRDLAARNCMLDLHYRVKVADFGLCRDIYEKGYYHSDNKKKLPIRWMAIESIENGAYSTKSDVWSFGVVIWEMLTRGVVPYPGVDGWDVINYLRRRRMAPPFFCPDEVYNLMMMCWTKNPDLRPTFPTLQEQLMLFQGGRVSDMPEPILIRKDQTKNGTRKPSTAPVKENAESPLSGELLSNTLPKPRTKPKPLLKPKSVPATKGNESYDFATEVIAIVTSENEGKAEEKEIVTPLLTEVNMNKKVLNNFMITIPACYSHRDLSKSAVNEYIQLIDNYEPAPKFSGPSLRPKKKQHLKRSGDSKKAGSHKNYPAKDHSSDLPDGIEDALKTRPQYQVVTPAHLMLPSSSDSIQMRHSKDGSYYELEHARKSTGVETDADNVSMRTSDRSSVMTGSMGSLLDTRSRCSSTYSGERGSRASNLSLPHRRISGVATPVSNTSRSGTPSASQTPSRRPSPAPVPAKRNFIGNSSTVSSNRKLLPGTIEERKTLPKPTPLLKPQNVSQDTAL